MKTLFLVATALLVPSSHAFGSVSVSTCSPRWSSSLNANVNVNANANANAKTLLVVSPPGGVGEVTVVKAASMGSAVKWFVVSSKAAKVPQSSSIALSQDTLAQIKAAGGSVELAGADAQALMGGTTITSGSTTTTTTDSNAAAAALAAVRTWCSTTSTTSTTGMIDALVCCMDGADETVKEFDEQGDPTLVWQNAVKLAAKEAASVGIAGRKLAILSVNDDEDDLNDTDNDNDNDNEENAKDGGGNIFRDFLGGATDKIKIPTSLASAIKANTKLRHGTLFGIPESSPSFSALLNGPQKNPTVCDEYIMRNVRVDPSISVSGNAMIQATTKSCRHAVGQAAALMSLELVQRIPDDVCVTSLRGMEAFDLWQDEFDRANTAMMMDAAGKGEAPQLFATSFAGVPNLERLSTWIATKWAPAVMRTYDIAAIRTGARPVYAKQLVTDNDTSDDTNESVVEIVWQELMDNYDSVTAGRMMIRITATGMVATRGAGDPTKGFGTISRKPLPGEAVLVRRLAEAASQAVEKGLARKPASAAVAAIKEPKKQAVVVSSLQTVQTVDPAVAAAAAAAAASGPRQSGAKRSSERTRGKRTRRADAPVSSETTTTSSTTEETKPEPGTFE